MAQQQYRLAISDSSFPLLSEQQGRTVMGATQTEIYAKDNKPGLYYCHNVMPTSRGLDSIGYKEIVAAAGLDIVEVRIEYSTTKERVHLGWTSTGAVYALAPDSTSWVAVSGAPYVPSFTSKLLTSGRVKGISYIAYSYTGVYTYNSATHSFSIVSFTGLIAAAILGVVASSGYLLAYTEDSIAWSSTIDPTDFTPSAVTGAGGGTIAGIGGSILFCTHNTLGILVFSDTNTIAAVYTGNAQYPFKFREVSGSKGGISQELIAYESNSEKQFLYSKGGLQAIDSQQAVIILPEVTDFLSGKRFEDYSPITELFTYTDLTSTMKKELQFIASRYLIISYGVTSYTHALVYDTALERLGKLKLDHACCFEYVGDLTSQIEVSKESIAFITPGGAVKVLDFSTITESDGVVFLGKLQQTKSRNITLLSTDLENIREGATLDVAALYSLDGKNSLIRPAVELDAATNGPNIRTYGFRVTGVNHTLRLTGQFNLVSAVINYTVNGRR